MRNLFVALTLLCQCIQSISAADGGQKPLKPPKGKQIDIPVVGLGLWNSKGSDATNAVQYAFKAGYHHLDSAAAYGNEDFVGKGLRSKAAPRDRSKYWITSKLWNDKHKPELVEKALNQTLSDLGVDYLDLYLMHWPVAFRSDAGGRNVIDQDVSITDTWRAMEDQVRRFNATGHGTRSIGISNFSPREVDDILKMCTICPFAHEFETHPYLQQQDFVSWHQNKNITVIAYSPLANMNPTYKSKYPNLPPILEDEFWTELAKSKNVTPAQAILGWGIQRGTVVMPKSIHEERIVENLKARMVKFSEDEMKEIANQDRKSRFNNPSKSWGVELFEGLDDGSDRFFKGEL